MYKFKTSKYKNAVAKLSKKEEWITDLAVSTSFSYGSLIKASAAFIYFLDDESGNSNLNVLPLDYKGKKPRCIPRLQCHAEPILDFDISPFDDGLVATGSQDCSVKLWHIPSDRLKDISNPEITLPLQKAKIENVVFHPTVDCILTVSSHDTLTLWDCLKQTELYCFNECNSTIQSVSWNTDGNLLVSSCKDKIIRILDPRSKSSAQETPGHGCPKDSRVVWLGDSEKILSTGFESNRQREACLRDIRNLSNPLKTVSFDTSNGILLPFYDPDTKMLFLAGKADASITFLEISDSDPYITEASRFITDSPTRDACMLPKRALNVMQAEVNRLLQLTPNAIVPVMYQVPRKLAINKFQPAVNVRVARSVFVMSYRDFHFDLFPDTDAPEPVLTTTEWLSGITKKRQKISLDPSKTSSNMLRKHCDSPFQNRTHVVTEVSSSENKEIKEEFVNNQAKAPVHTSNKIFQHDISQEEKESLDDIKYKSQDIKSQSSLDADKNSKLKKPIPLPKPAISPQLVKKHSQDSLTNSELIMPEVTSVSAGNKAVNADENYQIHEKNNSLLAKNSIELNKRDVLKESNRSEEKKDDVKEKSIHGADIFKKTPRSIFKDTHVSTPEKTSPHETSLKKDNSSPKPFTGFRVSKFRHLKGTPLHRSHHIENLRNLNTSLPGECDGVHTNRLRVALPLKGPGGRITILELNKPGRLPDGVLPVLQNGTNVMDFCWDPFNDQRLAVACDDGTIRIWVIPETGLVQSQETPAITLKGHSEKIYFVKFHPLAQDIIASASYDFTVRIWDLKTMEEKYCLLGHSEQIFNLAWSPDGKYFATVSKDSKIRIYNPRMTSTPIKEGPGPVGSRGARISWVLQGRYLVVSGFDKVSERLINLYNLEDLDKEVATIRIDVSPAILIPHYDEDSNTLFLTGKGDSTIYAYEVLEEQPYFFPLSHHKSPTVHQGLTFFPKITCNVKDVEFARALRLVGSVLEPLAFTVPRVKMDFFQDDLFPDTKILWEPTMTSEEWLLGMNKPVQRMSLLPEGMPLLSSSNPKMITTSKTGAEGSFAEKTTKEKEAEITKAISSRIGVEKSLPQDSMEGVDPNEWDD